MRVPRRVRMVEVGPRDGLQNEPEPAALETKVRLIDALTHAGLGAIEVGSFVSPRWVPQMAGTDEVFARIERRLGVIYGALVPNLQGAQRALAAGADELAVFAAASESFSRKNINCSVAESLERFASVCALAHSHGRRLRGYVWSSILVALKVRQI